MATVLHRREVEHEGVSFTLLTGEHAMAIAVEAEPSVSISGISARLLARLRAEGAVDEDLMVGLAFRGSQRPDPSSMRELVEASVYLAVQNLRDSAVENAQGFLDEVEAEIPEAYAIATFRRLEPLGQAGASEIATFSDEASKTSAQAELLARATEVFGSRNAAERWLSAPAIGLNGIRPIEMMQTMQDADVLSDYLARLESGGYS